MHMPISDKNKKVIFFGSNCHKEECYDLHKMLEEAFRLMGGIQQPPSAWDKSCAEEKTKQEFDQGEIEHIARIICYKLGAEKVLTNP